MHENEAKQEKDFRIIMSSMLQLGEERDKLIYEIDSVIDRIKLNRLSQISDSENPNTFARVPEDAAVIPTLKNRCSDMDKANEKLRLIVNRLTELI